MKMTKEKGIFYIIDFFLITNPKSIKMYKKMIWRKWIR
jgi:hypothetical protein